MTLQVLPEKVSDQRSVVIGAGARNSTARPGAGFRKVPTAYQLGTSASPKEATAQIGSDGSPRPKPSQGNTFPSSTGGHFGPTSNWRCDGKLKELEKEFCSKEAFIQKYGTLREAGKEWETMARS